MTIFVILFYLVVVLIYIWIIFGVDVQLYHAGSFVIEIPTPLGIGKIECDNGEWYSGFLVESFALHDAAEIMHFVGWRAFTKS